MALVVACDSTVETQDGGAGSGDGGAASQPDLPKPESCEEFCAFVHSAGCPNCNCNEPAVPNECLELAKMGWACAVENFSPEACGSSGCFEITVEEAACEEMY